MSWTQSMAQPWAVFWGLAGQLQGVQWPFLFYELLQSEKQQRLVFFFLSFKGKSWHSFAKNRALVILFPKTINSITFCLFFFFLKYFVLVEYNQQYKTTQSQLRISLENDDIDNWKRR